MEYMKQIPGNRIELFKMLCSEINIKKRIIENMGIKDTNEYKKWYLEDLERAEREFEELIKQGDNND